MISVSTVPTKMISSYTYFVHIGMILGYSITLVDSEGTTLSFSSTTESVVVNSLRCCSSYSYKVAASTSSGEGAMSQTFRFMTDGQHDGK